LEAMPLYRLERRWEELALKPLPAPGMLSRGSLLEGKNE